MGNRHGRYDTQKERVVYDEGVYIRAFTLGAILALTIGPITLLILNRSIRKGFLSGGSSAFGAALADGTYALVAFTIGLSLLPKLQAFHVWIRGISGSILIIIAFYLLVCAIRTHGTVHAEVPLPSVKSDLLSTYFLTLSNPLTLALFVGFIGQMSNISRNQVFPLTIAVFAGSLCMQLLYAYAASRLQKFFQAPSAILGLNVISALGIAIFGVMIFFT